MSAAQYFPFGDFALVFEDTLGSGSFTIFCGVQSLDWDRSADVTTTMIPECTDPDLPSTPVHFERSRSETINASGTIDKTTWARLNTWYAAKAKRNVRMFLDITPGGEYWSGLAIITNLKGTGTEHEPWKFSISLMIDGEMVKTAVS